MNIETIKSVYFVGAGGIGMSALVRYFLFKGKIVAGYDRTPTPLTDFIVSIFISSVFYFSTDNVV